MNKEKISFVTKKFVETLDRMQFSADESVALLKCLQRVLVVQAVDKDLLVVSHAKLKEVIDGRTSLDSILSGS